MANENLNFRMQRLHQHGGEETAGVQVRDFSETHWVLMTWFPTKIEDLQKETQTEEALLVSKHHLLGLPVQAKPVWDAINQANAEPVSLSRNQTGGQGEE